MDTPSFLMADMEISLLESITMFSSLLDIVMPKVGQVDFRSGT